jgi:signal transduction histidine kinase
VLVDGTVAGLLGVVALVTGWGQAPIRLLWALAVIAPLAVRRRYPVASVVAVYGLLLANLTTGVIGRYSFSPIDLLVLPALASVTLHGPRWAYRTAILAGLLGSTLFGVALVASAAGTANAIGSAIGAMLLTLTTFAFSLVRRARRDQIDALYERARRLEAERDQQAVSAAADERARIAREMHDIVAHSLSVIIAQADGGRYAGQAEPDAAVRSLTTIAETGRAALADMRRLLGVLRADEPDGTSEPPSGLLPALRPQPAVDEVSDLVDQVRASGLEVSMVRMGTPRTLPPGTGVAVYRICQESLTNVLKHAGPAAHATVLLQWGATSLILEVNDDGRGAGAADDGAGQGTIGMRERAAMLGGMLTLGPRPGGGFRVRAEIPIPPAPGLLPVPPAPGLEDR